jgi:hypothetical protein
MRAASSLEIPSGVTGELRAFLEAVREAIEIADGFRGASKDRYVTLGELEAAGLVKAVQRSGRAEIASAITGTMTKLVKVGVTPAAGGGNTVIIEGGGDFGTITFDSFASGIEPIGVVDGLPSAVGYTGPKVVFNTADGKLWRLVEGIWTKVIDPADIGGPIDPALIADGTIAGTKLASGLEAVGIVDDLPDPVGYTGPRVVFRTSNGKLYRLVSGEWTAAVPAVDVVGEIDEDQIADGSISGTKFAAGIEPVAVVNALPSPTGYTGPKVVFLTTNGKIYRLVDDEWEYKLPAADLAGQIAAGQIAPSSIGLTELAAGITPVEVVGTLPTTGLTDGRVVLLTSDNILYRYSTAEADWLPAETYIPDGTIGPGQLAANAVIAGKIAAGAVRAGEIAANAVTATTIAAGEVIAGKLGVDAVEANNIAANAVIVGKVAAGAIGVDQLQANSVTAVKIGAQEVIAGKLAANSVQAGNVAANAIQAGNIAANAVQAGNIAADAVTAGTIEAAAITARELDVGAVTSEKIAAGEVKADNIAANAITSGKILAGEVKAVNIAADAVEFGKIAAGAVRAAQLFSEAVESEKIKANAVQAVHIEAGAVTADKLESELVIGGIIKTQGDVRVELEGDATFPIWIGSGVKGSESGSPGAQAKFWYDIALGKLYMTGTLQTPEIVGAETLFRPKTTAGLDFDLAITRLFEWDNNYALTAAQWVALGPEIDWVAPWHGTNADAFKRVQHPTESILLSAKVDARNVGGSSQRTIQFRFTCQFDGAGEWSPVGSKRYGLPIFDPLVQDITSKTFNPIVYQTLDVSVIRRTSLLERDSYLGARNTVRYRLEGRVDPNSGLQTGVTTYGGTIVAQCTNFGSRLTGVNQ